MIQTVIFDMDGVIIDSEPIHKELQEELFAIYDISMSHSEYQAYIGRSSKNMWEELIHKFSLPYTIDEILERDKTNYHARLKREQGLAPIQGVRPLIESLCQNQVNLVLASSSSQESIGVVLGLFGLDHFFEHKISGADLSFSKPHPEIFEVAASAVPSAPEHCLVIEDSMHGVNAAKSAGMKCIGFQNRNSGNQDLRNADLIVDDIRKLSYEMIMELGK